MASGDNDRTQPLGQGGRQTVEIELHPGGLLADRYLIEKELGRGGMGVTYLARDKNLYSMLVVIKILLDKAQRKEWVKKKFIQEAEALTRISHPGVVKVLNRGEMVDGKPFLVMEFIEGQSLRSCMIPEGMDFEEVAQITRGLGNALHAAHEKGVLHRDIKPENILLQHLDTHGPTLKLIDFGIAKVKDSQIGTATEAGVIAGSVQYIAPEQLTGRPVSTATDVYSVALVLYEMLTGRRPFNPDAPTLIAALQQLIEMQRRGVEVKPQQLRPSLPEGTQQVLLKALEYEPGDRPQDVRAFCDDLADSLTRNVPTSASEFPKTPHTQAIDYSSTEAYSAVEDTNPPKSKSIAISPSPASAAINSAGVVEKTSVETVAGKKEQFLRPAMVILGIVVLLLSGFVIWQAIKPKHRVVTPKEAPVPELKLTYSLTRKAKGKSNPVLIYDTEPLQTGDAVWIAISCPQDSYLYVINESSEGPGKSSMFNILFPSEMTNGGSSKLGAGQGARLPESKDGYILDAKPGTEKLWFVLSANPIADFEKIARQWVNDKDMGRVKDSSQANLLSDYLYNHVPNMPKVEKDSNTIQMTLSFRGEVLVKMLTLGHF